MRKIVLHKDSLPVPLFRRLARTVQEVGVDRREVAKKAARKPAGVSRKPKKSPSLRLTLLVNYWEKRPLPRSVLITMAPYIALCKKDLEENMPARLHQVLGPDGKTWVRANHVLYKTQQQWKIAARKTQ